MYLVASFGNKNIYSKIHDHKLERSCRFSFVLLNLFRVLKI